MQATTTSTLYIEVPEHVATGYMYAFRSILGHVLRFYRDTYTPFDGDKIAARHECQRKAFTHCSAEAVEMGEIIAVKQQEAEE